MESLYKVLTISEIGLFVLYVFLIIFDLRWFFAAPLMIFIFYDLHGLRECIRDQVPEKEIIKGLFQLGLLVIFSISVIIISAYFFRAG